MEIHLSLYLQLEVVQELGTPRNGNVQKLWMEGDSIFSDKPIFPQMIIKPSSRLP